MQKLRQGSPGALEPLGQDHMQPPPTAWDHQGPAAQGSHTVISISWGQAQEMGGLLSMSPLRRDSQQWWEAELRPARTAHGYGSRATRPQPFSWTMNKFGPEDGTRLVAVLGGCRKVLGSAGSVGTPRGCGIPAWKSRCLNVGSAALYRALIRAAACSALRSACLPCARLNLNRIKWNFQT